MSGDTMNDDIADKQEYEHYGPAPDGQQERRGARQAQMSKKEVKLINGELILECKIPTILYSFLPRRDEIEFTHVLGPPSYLPDSSQYHLGRFP